MTARMSKVLLVDDQPHVLDALELLFELRGIETERATGPAQALTIVERGGVGLVVQDMNFSRSTTSGEEGVELFRAIRAVDPEMPVILMTAWGSVKTAVSLVKEGADDYLEKPWSDAELLAKARNLLRARKLERSHAEGPSSDVKLCGLVFESARMKALVRLAVKVGGADISTLIMGESGAGKEKIAEIVHANSRRSDKKFIKVNVGSLPDELFSAELFGAEAGAFTGAKGRRIGRFEEAHGGTLFLDELGNLSLESQAKLLRALESGEFERLGSNETRRVDVRVIAATNADLKRAIEAGTFREDLYYRLAVIELHVPALRQRPEDIIPLARHFIDDRFQAAGQEAGLIFSDACARTMLSYSWPGNVRELHNRVRRALLMCDGAQIEAEDLALDGDTLSGSHHGPPSTAPLDRSSFEAAERETLLLALEEANHVVTDAAKSLGVSRQSLYRRMRRLGISARRA